LACRRQKRVFAGWTPYRQILRSEIKMKHLIQKIAARYIRANLSPQTEKFLTSLAKGSLVNVPQKILIESLETLGFRITQVTATREINDQEFLHWCKSNKLYGNVVDQYRNILDLPTLEKHSKVTLGKPPSSPKVNHLYLTVKKEVKFDGVEIHVPQEVYLGAKGLEIQGSKTFTYTGEMGPLWKFLQEENVFSLAQDYLGIDENNSSQQRTLENTGHCGICGKNVKMRSNGTLHDHGFTRRKWQGRSGQCFGAGSLAIETSPDVYKRYIPSLAKILSEVQNLIRKGERGEFPAEVTTFRGRIKVDPSNDRVTKNILSGWQKEKEDLEQDLRHYEGLLRDWKPTKFRR